MARVLENPLSRYGFAVATIALAIGVARWLYPAPQEGFFLIPAASIALIAWVAGTAPSLIASACALGYYIAGSVGTTSGGLEQIDAVALTTFVVVTAFLAWIGGERRRTLEHADAQELQRAELEAERQAALQSERAARLAAERASERAGFLAEVGALLSQTLDVTRTAHALARLAVPTLADYVAVFVVSPDGELGLLAYEHADPERRPLVARAVSHLIDGGAAAHSPIGDVLRDREPRLINATAEERGLTGTPLGESLRELGARSVIAAPVLQRGALIALIALARCEGRPVFDDDDLRLVLDVATRAALALDNARLYQDADTASRAKDQFLAVLSHELRTPLTPALAAIDSLLEDAPPSEDRCMLELIKRNVELEARLIDDLLDLTRIVRGKLDLHLSRCDVHTLIRSAIEVVSADLAGRSLRITVEPMAGRCAVEGDSARLQQILWNLVKNAIKFTPDTGSVIVRTRNAAEGLEVHVIDTGAGIPAEDLPRVFEAFEQGGGAARRGGLGLGLTISRSLARAHGGELSVASDGAGKGARFTLWLPLAPVVPDAHHPEPETVLDHAQRS